MKKTMLTMLVLAGAVSSLTFAEWAKISESRAVSYYIDFEELKKADGYIYWWLLIDYRKPTPVHGDLSTKTYNQGDCKLFRLKRLRYSFHKEPMGRGNSDLQESEGENRKWKYPSPKTVDGIVLKKACDRVYP